MTRCKSWRYMENPGHPIDHVPGTCRECWRPCDEETVEGRARCGACLDILAGHPNPHIRLALLSETDIPKSTVELLSQDSDLSVHLLARERLSQMGVQTHSVGASDVRTTYAGTDDSGWGSSSYTPPATRFESNGW